MTGFNLDKNGNFRFTLNIYSQLLIDKKMTNGDWVNAREIFLGLTYKGKLVVKETKPGEKVLLIVSKNAEVSNVKILDENQEEVVVEQMMITSGLNVQFEQVISLMKPYEIPLKNPPTPKEVECLGFKLTDLNVGFKKGYMEIGCGYKTVDVPSDPKTCESFMNALRNGPSEIMDMADKFVKNPEEFLSEMDIDLPTPPDRTRKQMPNKKKEAADEAEAKEEVIDVDNIAKTQTDEL